MDNPTVGVPGPDWLTRRDATLRSGIGNVWYVVFDRGPQYSLKVVPAAGKYTCSVTQTNNGKRVDRGSVFATTEEALRGGLEELRQAVGW
jgi:hypothetical protein